MPRVVHAHLRYSSLAYANMRQYTCKPNFLAIQVLNHPVSGFTLLREGAAAPRLTTLLPGRSTQGSGFRVKGQEAVTWVVVKNYGPFVGTLNTLGAVL